MYRRLLVGYKDTEQGHDALELGRILAQATGAEPLIATVPGNDADGIARLARAEGADLVVVGSTHRGPIGRVVPGASVERFLADPPCAVAVAPPGFGRPLDGNRGWRPLSGDAEDAGMRVIGVGFDGSAPAREALGIATELALANGAALRVYTVAPRLVDHAGAATQDQATAAPTAADALREQLHRAVAALPAEARALPVFLWGEPATELVGAAENGVDLIVLGSRSGGRVRRALNGSVSGIVIREASCPVLISPSGVTAPEATLA